MGYVTPPALYCTANAALSGSVPHSAPLPGFSVSAFSADSVPLAAQDAGKPPATEALPDFRAVDCGCGRLHR